MISRHIRRVSGRKHDGGGAGRSVCSATSLQRRVCPVDPPRACRKLQSLPQSSNPKNRINFLKAATSQDIAGEPRTLAERGDAVAQPHHAARRIETHRRGSPARLHWIENRLRQTACAAGDLRGRMHLRRLNRREYHNTIRDLLGVDFDVSELFPRMEPGAPDSTPTEKRFIIPPLLMERYMEAAQQILDRVIVTPDLLRM